jgi:uncharacterized membrane-anchored protein YhcB (DUF1043 family)
MEDPKSPLQQKKEEFRELEKKLSNLKVARTTLESENTKEEESWTEEDEKTLNNLIMVLENAEKRLEEIDIELQKISETEDDTLENLQTNINKIETELSELKNKKEQELLKIDIEEKEQEKLYKEFDQLNETLFKIIGEKIGILKFTEKKNRTKRCMEIEIEIEKIRKNIDSKSNLISSLYEQHAKLLEEIPNKELEYQEIKKSYEKELITKDKKENPFKYFITDKMSNETFKVLFLETKDNIILSELNKIFLDNSGKELKLFKPSHILPGRNNSVFFSSNGFSLQLQNIEEIQGDKSIDIHNPKAKYLLVSPDWAVNESDKELGYEKGIELLEEKAKKYQEEMLEIFNKNNIK